MGISPATTTTPAITPLVDIPRFDEHGLWTYHQARFSKWGSLTGTIVGLVGESSAGLTADQLKPRLHLEDAQPLLVRLTQRKLLTREKMEGCFVYFPLQETARGRLHKQRTKEIERARAARTLPPAEHIVALLVQIIQRPRDTPRQWARRLAQRNIRIGTRDNSWPCRSFRSGSYPPSFVVSRTNNPAEHRFGSTKRGVRRKMGVNKLTRYVQAMRAEELLVANLSDPDYVDLVCDGSLANLPAVIAKYWDSAQAIRAERLQSKTDHPLPTSKKQLRDPQLLDNLKQTVINIVQIISGKPQPSQSV